MSTSIPEWIDQSKLDWERLSKIEKAVPYLEAHPEKIHWEGLSSNSKAVHLLIANQSRIHWDALCLNDSPEAMELLDSFLSTLTPERRARLTYESYRWHWLSYNEYACTLLEKYPEMIDWVKLTSNRNPNVLPLLEKNLDKIKISNLYSNSNTIHLFNPADIPT